MLNNFILKVQAFVVNIEIFVNDFFLKKFERFQKKFFLKTIDK